MAKQKKIGLALGGGGARGIAHIGAVRTLLDEGIRPDYLAGSSMGAMIASFLALGFDWDDVEARALSFDKKNALTSLLDLGRLGQALIKGEKIKRFLKEYLGDAEFSDTKTPLAILACDLYSGEEIIIRDGLIREAIMASIAVPGIFPPQQLMGRILVDGGLVNPTPVDIVKKMGADIVIGVDLIGKQRAQAEKLPGLVDTLMLSYEVMRNQAIADKLHHHCPEAIMVRPTKRELFDSFRFYDAHAFIHSGEESMKEALPEIRKKIGK